MCVFRSFILFITALSLSGCLNQSPAPIEYGVFDASPPKAEYHDAAASSTPKTNQKTNWGGKEYKEKVEKPLMLSDIATGKEIYHEVIEGETIDTIARKYGISRDVLIKVNDLEPPYQLEELQLIMIPAKNAVKKNPVAKNAPVKTPVSRKGKLPVEGKVVSHFGQRYLGSINQGVNISAPMDAKIYSSSTGEVIHSSFDHKFGNLLIVRSDSEDIFMAYAHMSSLMLKVGDRVVEGEMIGHVGSSGKVTKPQLHFAIRKGKIPIDPLGYIKR